MKFESPIVPVPMSCRFPKRSGNSTVRVTYAGNLRVYCCSQCLAGILHSIEVNAFCPMTIEGLVLSTRKGDDIYSHRQIEL